MFIFYILILTKFFKFDDMTVPNLKTNKKHLIFLTENNTFVTLSSRKLYLTLLFTSSRNNTFVTLSSRKLYLTLLFTSSRKGSNLLLNVNAK